MNPNNTQPAQRSDLQSAQQPNLQPVQQLNPQLQNDQNQNNQDQNQIQNQNQNEIVNPKIAISILGVSAVVILGLVIAVIATFATHGNSRGNNVKNLKPSLELAKTVCASYDGDFIDGEDARFGGYFSDEYFASDKVCQRYTHNQASGDVAIGPADFSFEIGELKEETKEQYRSDLISSVVGSKGYQDVSAYAVLENSDEYFKACNSVAGLMILCEGIYDDIMVMTMTSDIATTDTLFAELGFPDRARLADYISSRKGSSTNDDYSEEEEEDEERNESEYNERSEQKYDGREKDYASLKTAISSYIANSGDIDGLIERGDPSKLNASKLIGEDAEDPDGNPYEVISYTYNTWSKLSGVEKLPSGKDKSQVFVIIHANCDGTDANNYPMPAADTGKRSFAIYGYQEDGYYCQASNSAK